ncbi:Lrp/AsnC family transcriptional regulator [Paenibacillus filicis]|uniref:Lrp/AsnC family transcriptional regulator n=1 Tax=Paenibacillus gyeongsangnamensis TaxID=3388067 RepID=A0ABT4Q831_9BACL|nr:Lrp/AsnC family transcriptional regulator [Paenibacillus filicis]MCZ8512984.1 Lrp/AsnC family transcriptional regulator [Paenibacillus filicis]
MTTSFPDEIDMEIIRNLMEDSTLSHKEIGQRVHLTGQAVGARVRKLEDMGVIDGYTLKWNPEKLGLTVLALVTVFMKLDASHARFQSFLRREEKVEEAHRVSGEGCYWLKVRVADHEALNAFLDELLHYGNYRVSLSIGAIKPDWEQR